MRAHVKYTTAALLALVFVVAEVHEAQAQEIILEGPLVGQPAVRHLKLLRKGRLSIAPNIGFTLQDDFRRNIIFGAKIEYNITDWLSIGVWGGYSLGVDTKLTKSIKSKAVSNQMNLPDSNRVGNQIGKLNWITTLQLNIIPFRGKIAFFSKGFVAADLYIFVGAGVAGVEDRGYAADEEASLDDPGYDGNKSVTCQDTNSDGVADNYDACLNMESRVTFVPTFGVGLDFFANEWMG